MARKKASSNNTNIIASKLLFFFNGRSRWPKLHWNAQTALASVQQREGQVWRYHDFLPKMQISTLNSAKGTQSLSFCASPENKKSILADSATTNLFPKIENLRCQPSSIGRTVIHDDIPASSSTSLFCQYNQTRGPTKARSYCYLLFGRTIYPRNKSGWHTKNNGIVSGSTGN